MYPRVTAVEPMAGFRLLLTFDSGEVREFDVSPYLDKGVFREFRDETLFRSVHVSFDTVEWGNGADLCPELLYAAGVPVQPARETPALAVGEEPEDAYGDRPPS